MKRNIELNSTDEARLLCGPRDGNLRTIEEEAGVEIFARGHKITVEGTGKAVGKTLEVIEELLAVIRKGGRIGRRDITYAARAAGNGNAEGLREVYLDRVEVSSKRQYITPRSKGQKGYVDAIRGNDIVFGIGPAGTGKTYLAMAMAVNALRKQLVSRIILARPAVEAGESLGFLPGNLYEKVNPYLRPLYDALYDMVEPTRIQEYLTRGIIEVVPLAYMRGRTLNNAFIILDEAQNSTPEQMKMFLTRLGFDSKTVITGDITQSDLPDSRKSGLKQVINILKDISGIEFVFLSGEDVVRHELVQDIIRAYEKIRGENDG